MTTSTNILFSKKFQTTPLNTNKIRKSSPKIHHTSQTIEKIIIRNFSQKLHHTSHNKICINQRTNTDVITSNNNKTNICNLNLFQQVSYSCNLYRNLLDLGPHMMDRPNPVACINCKGQLIGS